MKPTTQKHSVIRRRPSESFYGYAEGEDVISRFLVMKYANANTRTTYEPYLRRFACLLMNADMGAWHGATLTPDGVRQATSVHVDAFLEALDQMNLSASTIAVARGAIMKFFKHMVAVGMIERNPADPEIIRAAPKLSQAATIKHLSREEANECVAAASMTTGVTGTRDRCIMLMLAGTAVRRSELVAIDIEHIRRQGEGWELYIPVSKTGPRTVPIESHVMEAIRELQAAEAIASGPLFRSSSRDPRYNGRRLTARGLWRIVRRVTALAGHETSPHTFRHTACTLALKAGAHLVQAQKFLGHASPNTTIIYEHLINDADNSAAKFVNVTG